MKTVTEQFVEALIDFAPTEETKRMGFAERQLRGVVGGYNMLARNRVAYIADEVGLGKTYVALGIMGLIRYLKPTARIVVLTPRENIQHKWIKELRNFTRFNWKYEDNRVKNLQGNPVHSPLACGRIDELIRSLGNADYRDLFLRNSTFSQSVKDLDARKRMRKRILPSVPWINRKVLRPQLNEKEFRDNYGRVLNSLVPDIDLLIVDEAHNFKHGFGPRSSNRNRVVGLGLGHPDGASSDFKQYGHRIKNLLMLSATPFEYDYRDLFNQLDVFGMSNIRLKDGNGDDPIPVRRLIEDD